MEIGLARYDLAFWQWAQSDEEAHRVFQRVMEKRFSFAKWMFSQIGFDATQAEVRGRMMVVYMMGESTLVPGPPSERKKHLRIQYEVLTAS